MRPGWLALGTAAFGAVALVLACSDDDSGSSSSSTSSSSSSSSSTSSTSSGGDPDAAPRVTKDGGGGSEAGAGGDTTTMPCGEATCTLATEHCCSYNNDAPPPLYRFACVEGALCPLVANASDAVALRCSGAANCAAGTVCCLFDDNTVTHESRCVPTDQCKDVGTQIYTAQLCDPAQASSGCPLSAPCSTMNISDWNLPPGYATCGGKRL